MKASPLDTLATVVQRLVRGLEALQPLALLAARLYLAKVFFWAGLTKLRDWETTVALFTHEYQVPWLPPDWAAALGTAGELVLPVLLVLGLGTRLAALALSALNAVAAISLPELGDAAWQQHLFWGCLALGLVLWGGGPLSLDGRLKRRWWPRPPA